ncbi:MAG: asparagine synthase (glutamine-hydrolyzing) [Sedimentisphaerales bacterium]|nr:asparagine synthase (glutamine-hydrolyzing) [Sedimentisphaerales bacterium]
MCGIVGICRLGAKQDVDPHVIQRMMAISRHRGPDEAGIYLDDRVALGHLRLSIIDLQSGCQPIHNEDQTLWIIYNGEAFNYVELKGRLEQQGHRFYTTTDTEVILHLYEQEGPECVKRLNGQFAFAIWDSEKRELFLARDRVGIRPLHYTIHDGKLIFASEIKSIFAATGVPRQLDPVSLDEIFTVWTVLPGRTAFRDVYELPPGHCMRVAHGAIDLKRYWEIPIYGRDEQLTLPVEVVCEQIDELLIDAIRIRLRADVPIGCYVSGGLDSSGVAALATQRLGVHWNTFGIRFDQEAFDEGIHQDKMASFLGSSHRELWATPERIGDAFADTLWHCEKPLLRTAPVPLHMLSGIVRESGLKVVLTGEGADEVFGGYDIFKEAKVRQFWNRRPGSAARAALVHELYADVFQDHRTQPFLPSFFGKGLDRSGDPLFSHILRWDNTSRIKTFFSNEVRAAIGTTDPYERIRQSLPPRYHRLDAVAKAQYLETLIFLSNYLLSSQGDRVAMANSVEIRLPYLDYRIIELMASVPSRWKILGLDEKHILKKVLAQALPKEIVARRKQPYRAPIVRCLLSGASGGLARELLSEGAIKRLGFFDAAKVDKLLKKLQTAKNAGEIDSMALAGILSTQIIHQQFVEDFDAHSEPVVEPDLVVDRRAGMQSLVLGMRHQRHHRQTQSGPALHHNAET